MSATVEKLQRSHGNSLTMQNMVKRMREIKRKFKSEKRPPKPKMVVNNDKHGVNDTLVQAESSKPSDSTVVKVQESGAQRPQEMVLVVPELAQKPPTRTSVRPPSQRPPAFPRVNMQRLTSMDHRSSDNQIAVLCLPQPRIRLRRRL